MEIEQIDLEDWEQAMPSSGFEVFHTAPALAVIDEHAAGELRLFAGFKGNQAIGLFPAFVQHRNVGKVIVSPPPYMGIPRAGPLFMPTSPKQRKTEQLNRRFVNAVLKELGADRARTLFRTTCPLSYSDPRPFSWAGFDVSTEFSYVVNLAGLSEEELLRSFSSRLRETIRKGETTDDFVVTVGDLESLKAIYERTGRLDGKHEPPPYPWEYTRELVTALRPEDRCRIYEVRSSGGTVLSAAVILYSNNLAYYWQGFPDASIRGVNVQTMIHWEAIKDVLAGVPIGTVRAYDLMEANSQSSLSLKSTFGTHPTSYYRIETGGLGMRLAKKAYQMKRAIL